jgi:ferredoxin
MSFISTYKDIPSGTLIRTYDLDGKLVSKWNCTRPCEVGTASLALMIKAAAALNVPQQSIHLVWLKLEGMHLDEEDADTNSDPLMKAKADVQVYLEPLKDEDQDDIYRCYVCLDPCEDVDEGESPKTRIENCDRCNPCSLCTKCHVQVTNIIDRVAQKVWVCFACLEPHEMMFLDVSQKRRYNLALLRFSTAEPVADDEVD